MSLKQPIRKGAFHLLIFVLLLLFSHEQTPFAAAANAGKIRESVLAGTWYPENPKDLRKQLNIFLKEVPPKTMQERLVALIVPHAGYRYSGQVAAHAYKLLEAQKFETVVIVDPTDRLPG
jgi:hypothetical protein